MTVTIKNISHIRKRMLTDPDICGDQNNAIDYLQGFGGLSNCVDSVRSNSCDGKVKSRHLGVFGMSFASLNLDTSN